MSFTTEIANKKYQKNLVISIDGKFYSEFQVDADAGDIIGTGSGIESDKIGTIRKASINPITVDIRNVRTTTQTVTLDLLDLNEIVTVDMQASATQFLDTEIVLYVGFITGSFDFGDYKTVSKTTAKRISHTENRYAVNGAEVTNLMNKDMFTTFDTLDGAITDSATTLTLNDATSFPTSGALRIGDEFLLYSGKSVNDLTGLSRGNLSSTAVAHADDAKVDLVTETGSINPITLMLQLMISPGGGGTFDVLSDGLGIDESLVDTATFTAIRDANFGSDLYSFNVYDVGNGLRFLENELCNATNTRFFPKDGKISLALLDQVDFAASVPTLNEDSIVGTPKWTINSDKIVNKIEVSYGFIHGTQTFSRVDSFESATSIASYGAKPVLKLEFKGIQPGLSGASIASDRASRLLSRLATPRGEITVRTHFDQFELNIGDKVQVEHRFVPQQGGSLGISDQLEILSKSTDFSSGINTFKFQYTSFSGFRIAVIAPSHFVKVVTSQSVFDIEAGAGTSWRVGDKVRLWDDVLNAYVADPVNEIAAISTDTVTVLTAWATTLIVDTHVLKVADYDDATTSQRGRYGFIVDSTNQFSDGSKGYQIIL